VIELVNQVKATTITEIIGAHVVMVYRCRQEYLKGTLVEQSSRRIRMANLTNPKVVIKN
jgi:hypothetical protein